MLTHLRLGLYTLASDSLQEKIVALLNENDVAPAFAIPNQDGTTTTLEQYLGKSVVLWWYPKANTPG